MQISTESRLMFNHMKRDNVVASFFVCCFAFSLIFFSTHSLKGAYAQQSQGAGQNNNAPQQGAIDINSIFQQLVIAYPNGGNEFMSAISSMVVASPQTASSLISIVNQAAQTPNPQSPIKEVHIADVGRALARSVARLNETNPEIASQITGLVAQSNNQPLQTAFVSQSGDATAATGDGNDTNTNTNTNTGTGDNADQPGSTDNPDQPGATGPGGGGGTGGNILSGNNGGGGGGTISPSS